jgi:hypothetical protein
MAIDLAPLFMRDFFVVWTYRANYGQITVQAATAEDAARIVRDTFSDDFRRKATIYVMPADSVTIIQPDTILAPRGWDSIDTSHD